jgi:MoaA/NifB/PqqE/SkfB family radical SAM enzyme
MTAPPPLPPRLQVEVTNRCSLGCASCARHHWDEHANAPGQLDEGTLERLQPLLEGAVELTIGGYGDPSEGRLLLPLVERARAAGCSTRMITGGSRLTPKLIEQLADAGLDRLVLSMDGATDATLKPLRGVPLRSWLRWLRAARAVRARTGGLRPLTQLNVVVQWPNLDELVALVELCAREDVAGIHAFHLKSYAPALDDRCLLSEPERARPVFHEARRAAERLGVFLQLPPLDPEPVACRQPFEVLFVRHDGRVRGCCSALFEPPDLGLPVGHIEQPIEALWNAPVMERFRAAAARFEQSGIDDVPAWPEPCRGCAFRLPTLSAHLRPLVRIGESRVAP